MTASAAPLFEHYSFQENPEVKQGAENFIAKIKSRISSLGFNSVQSFNCTCKEIVSLWQTLSDCSLHAAPKLSAILQQINEKHGQPESIKTSWGGVLVTEHDNIWPWKNITKYLAVNAGCYLAFEKHDLKDETLKIEQGAAVLLYRKEFDTQLTLRVMFEEDTEHLKPGQEHCLIAVQDLLVLEKSNDPKGMDQDLIFIYTPDFMT